MKPAFNQACLLGLVATALVAQTVPFADRESRYHIQPLDVVEVHYRYSPEFDQTATVQPDGFVSLPLLGDLKLESLTIGEAKAAVLSKASERLRDPEVTFTLKEFEKPYFVVGGEVNTPGRYDMRSPINALQAISMAGGFKSASAKHSQVILYRKVGRDMVKAEVLDLKTALNRSSATEPLPNLKPGDMLLVPQNQISKVERIIKLANLGAYFPLP
ncbi:MAG: polysaccharide biosynthesis/export family protein [Acidobacteriota bacterium]|nr:polysaccharide biosynthesis/export family protein [Acidobacteriota bacterium]